MVRREKSRESWALREPGVDRPEVQTKASVLSKPQQCAPQEGLERPWCADSNAENLRDPSLSSPVCLRVSACLCELDPSFPACVPQANLPTTLRPLCPRVASVPGLESHPQPSLFFSLFKREQPVKEGDGGSEKVGWGMSRGIAKLSTPCARSPAHPGSNATTTNQGTNRGN